jgi:hypothetical protein
MDDRRLHHHEAGALCQHRRAAEEEHEPQAHQPHRLDPPPRKLEASELHQTGGAGGSQEVARERVDAQEQKRRQKIAEQLMQRRFHRCPPSAELMVWAQPLKRRTRPERPGCVATETKRRSAVTT